MGRPILYPEGRTQMNAIVPKNVKAGVQAIARRQSRSVSQVVTIILRLYLSEQGDLPAPEKV